MGDTVGSQPSGIGRRARFSVLAMLLASLTVGACGGDESSNQVTTSISAAGGGEETTEATSPSEGVDFAAPGIYTALCEDTGQSWQVTVQRADPKTGSVELVVDRVFTDTELTREIDGDERMFTLPNNGCRGMEFSRDGRLALEVSGMADEVGWVDLATGEVTVLSPPDAPFGEPPFQQDVIGFTDEGDLAIATTRWPEGSFRDQTRPPPGYQALLVGPDGGRRTVDAFSCNENDPTAPGVPGFDSQGNQIFLELEADSVAEVDGVLNACPNVSPKGSHVLIDTQQNASGSALPEEVRARPSGAVVASSDSADETLRQARFVADDALVFLGADGGEVLIRLNGDAATRSVVTPAGNAASLVAVSPDGSSGLWSTFRRAANGSPEPDEYATGELDGSGQLERLEGLVGWFLWWA